MTEEYKRWIKDKSFTISNGIMSTNLDNKSDKFTRNDIESTVNQFDISSLFRHLAKYKSDFVEHNNNFPLFIDTIFYYIFNTERIPSPDGFLWLYSKLNFEILDDEKIKYENVLYDINSIYYRALNGYTSIIRDFHFYHLCYDANFFDNIFYSIRYDGGGTDMIVSKQNKKLCVDNILDSPRALEYYEIKRKIRHKNEKNPEIKALDRIPIIIKKDRENTFGDFYLAINENLDELKSHF